MQAAIPSVRSLPWNGALMSGYLTKRGHVRKNWKRRWFILTARTLYYFRDPAAARPINELHLRGGAAAVVEESAEHPMPRARTFELRLKQLGVSYFLQADSARDYAEWVGKLREATEARIVGYPFDVVNRLRVEEEPKDAQFYQNWERALLASGLTQDELNDHPTQALQVLSFLYRSELAAAGQLVEGEEDLAGEGASVAAPSSSPAARSPAAARGRYAGRPALEIAQMLAIAADSVLASEEEVSSCRGYYGKLFEGIHSLADITNPDDPRKIYENAKSRIGRGGFGEVFLGRARVTGQRVAIKKMKISARNRESNLISEIVLLRACAHRNIVKYVDSYLVSDTVWVVTEYYGGGSLVEVLDMVAAGEVEMTEQQISSVCAGVVAALAYLHERHRIHRDIKSNNVLLSSEGEVKLADFGFAVQLDEASQLRHTMLGTAYWMAPEMIKGYEYGKKVDIWALGVLLYEMIVGQPPYIEFEPTRALLYITTRGVRVPSTRAYSEEFLDFLGQCLCLDQDMRSSASELQSHPFLANAGSPALLKPLIAEAKKHREEATCTLT